MTSSKNRQADAAASDRTSSRHHRSNGGRVQISSSHSRAATRGGRSHEMSTSAAQLQAERTVDTGRYGAVTAESISLSTQAASERNSDHRSHGSLSSRAVTFEPHHLATHQWLQGQHSARPLERYAGFQERPRHAVRHTLSSPRSSRSGAVHDSREVPDIVSSRIAAQQDQAAARREQFMNIGAWASDTESDKRRRG